MPRISSSTFSSSRRSWRQRLSASLRRGQRRLEGHCSDPAADTTRDRVRVPRVVVTWRIGLDPTLDEPAGPGDVTRAGGAEHVLAVVLLKAAETGPRVDRRRRLEGRRAPQGCHGRNARELEEPGRIAAEAAPGERPQRTRPQLARPGHAERVHIQRRLQPRASS